MADATTELLDPSFLRLLERLTLSSKRAYAGVLKGEKRSLRRGVSVEFADYRDYVPGDDLRYVDWNVYGRLDRLLLKLFVEEEDLRVYLVLDRSASMAFGTPTKFSHARRLTAALAWLALTGLDRLTVASFATGLDAGLPPVRGGGNARRVWRHLSALEPAGATALGPSLTRFAQTHRHPGLCVVVSDFLDPEGYQAGLKALLARRFDVVAVQVLAAEELRPELTGDLALVDAETGAQREVSISDSLLRRYRQTAEDYCGALRQFCVARGMGYLQTLTGEPLEQVVSASLRRIGLVR